MSGERKFKGTFLGERTLPPDDPMFTEGWIVSPMLIVRSDDQAEPPPTGTPKPPARSKARRRMIKSRK